jgi:hypothetical protein
MTEKTYTSGIGVAVYKNGIFHVRYNAETITLEAAKKWVAEVKREFADVLPAPTISDISNQKTFAKEVRDYMASSEVLDMMTAGALVAGSVVARVVGNFFLMFSKPPIPAKLFSDEASARKWLEQYKK